MKATLEFTLPDEKESFENACNGSKHKDTIEEIWNKVFRPAFKHGYSGKHADELNKLLQHDNDAIREQAERVVEMLSELYQEVIHED